MAILFITSTRLGDAILSTGLLNRLLQDHPDEQVTIACGAPAAGVFAATPRLEALHVMHKRRGSLHWLDLWRAVAHRRWKLVVDLRRSPVSLLVRSGRRHWMPRPGLPLPRVELIARALDLPPQAPFVHVAPQHEAAAERRIPAGRPVLALAPGAGWIGKAWPAERYASLVDLLTGPGGPLAGAHVLLVGAENERATAAPLLAAIPPERRIDAFGLDVLSTHAALARCNLFVGNDSAMMHLAAAVGIRTVGLFGPTRDDLYAPWGPEAMVVRTPETVDELMARPLDASLMGSLAPATVAAAIAARWPEDMARDDTPKPAPLAGGGSEVPA